jgi:hypothetical protein
MSEIHENDVIKDGELILPEGTTRPLQGLPAPNVAPEDHVMNRQALNMPYPKIHVSYWYERQDGSRGIADKVIVCEIPDIRTQVELEGIRAVIKGNDSGVALVSIITWSRLDN